MSIVALSAGVIDLWVEQMHEESDPFQGEPESWPSWTDEVWTLTEPAPEPEPYEPSEDDREWAASEDIADQVEDMASAAEWVAWVERLRDMHDYTDRDFMDAIG